MKEKNPDTCLVFKLFSLVAEPWQIDNMRGKYLDNFTYGYGHAKKEFLGVILEKYKKQREVFNFYMENPAELEKMLQNGEEKARAIAEATMKQVRNILKFD